MQKAQSVLVVLLVLACCAMQVQIVDLKDRLAVAEGLAANAPADGPTQIAPVVQRLDQMEPKLAMLLDLQDLAKSLGK